MESLKTLLNNSDVRGVVRSADGHLHLFHQRGVTDLFKMLQETPEQLKDASVCDRVIGKGAAWLMVKAGVKEAFALVMSEPALNVLTHYGVNASYNHLTPSIINHAGTGICPVEKLTASASNPDEAFQLIKHFIEQ